MVGEGIHPRLITEGYEIGKNMAMKILEECKMKMDVDSSLLTQVARTSLNTKLHK